MSISRKIEEELEARFISDTFIVSILSDRVIVQFVGKYTDKEKQEIKKIVNRHLPGYRVVYV